MHEITLGTFQCPFELWTPAAGRVFENLFAYDTETTDIDDERPYLVPSFVVGSACDGRWGLFLTWETVPPLSAAATALGVTNWNGTEKDVVDLVDLGGPLVDLKMGQVHHS